MREMTVPAQYLQIAADVASRVAAGDLPEGERLFGRSVMASEYGVSPETIRRDLEKLEQEIQALYLQIMENPNMQAFDTAKQAMNMMMQEVDTILSLCANGEDPDRCHPDLTNCTGNCSSCGGCH